jgi:hypothetical protein
MTRSAVPEEAGAGRAVAEPVSREAAGPNWMLRLVTVARQGPDLGSHIAIAALLIVILGIDMRTGIVPGRECNHRGHV